MTATPATWDEIVQCFLALFDHKGDPMRGNWGTSIDERDRWHVNDETYINGVVFIYDGDYEMSHFIEVVDRTTGVVTYGVIAMGPYGKGHDSIVYPYDVGTFFDRKERSYEVLSEWGLTRMIGLLEGMRERHRPG